MKSFSVLLVIAAVAGGSFGRTAEGNLCSNNVKTIGEYPDAWRSDFSKVQPFIVGGEAAGVHQVSFGSCSSECQSVVALI
jgi:hypothetical protein